MDLELAPRDGEQESRQRNVSERMQQTKPKSNGAIARSIFFAHIFHIIIEYGLDKIARLLARKGLTVLVISFLFFGVLCLGFLRKPDDLNPTDLYQSGTTEWKKDFKEASKVFVTLDSWKIQVNVKSKAGKSVLSSGCLKDADWFHGLITKSSYYITNCVRNKDGRCMTQSPSKLQTSNLGRKDLETLTGVNQNMSGQVTRNVFRYHETLFFYNISFAQNISIGGFVSTYFIKKPEDDQARTNLKDWIKYISSLLKAKKTSLLSADIDVLDTNNAEDNVWSVLVLSRLPLFYSIPVFVVLGFFFAVAIMRSHTSFLVFPLFVSCTLITSICEFAVFNLFGFQFQEMLVIVPCFLSTKAFVDSMLLVKALDTVSHLPSSFRRATVSLRNGGMVVTSTFLINILLFGVPIWSSFKGIYYTFVLALLTAVLTYITTLALFFNVILLVTSKYPIKCFASRCSHERKQRPLLKNFIKSWVQFLTTVPAKVIFTLMTAGMIAVFIYVLTTTSGSFDSVDTFFKESNVNGVKSNSFRGSTRDIEVLFKGLNYSSHSTRAELIKFSYQLESSFSDKRLTANWLSTFENWKERNGKDCTFYPCLKNFLNNSITSLFKASLQFENQELDSPIQTSRFQFPLDTSKNIISEKETVDSFQKETQKSSFGKYAKVTSKRYVAVKDFIRFLYETLYVFIILGVALLFSLLAITASLRTPFVLLFMFVMLTFEVITAMFLLEASFNQLSFPCVFLAFALAFNFCLYVSNAFIISKKLDVKDRVFDAVYSTAPPIFLGCLLLLLMSVAMGFAFPYLSVIFIRVIPITVALGAFHAFVMLPFLLASYGNKFSKRFGHSSVPVTSFIAHGGKNYKVPIVNETSTNTPKFQSIAIIGMGCRFPSVSNKHDFWDMLTEGRCSNSTFPENRTEEFKQFKERFHPKRFVPGRLCTMGGSYLENIKRFDAAFFNISSQEANSMDPQQKILLQVAYEAIEDAGMKLEDLQVCQTGVFVGLMNSDFGQLMLDENAIGNLDQFGSTGMSPCIASNRISFCFNFKGPSMTVDTACSSSLTALNLAVESLRNGNCRVALVCGTNILMTYKNQIVNGMAGLLAPDGKCKSFDASGDGYGRGEGVAVIVLKLSGDALNDEDNIYCDVVACGMNNDGASAIPITAPSIRGQTELYQTVLNRSGLTPNDLDYIEAHGTGTVIGDVVETSSMAEAYASTERTLRIGSIKSNLNHTESTAGIAGVMKLALMIKNGTFVPTVNIVNLNPKLKLAERGMIVQQSLEPWRRNNGKPRTGAVNSFGFGGSNAHAILQEVIRPLNYNELEESNDYCNGLNIITLSARSLDALKDSAQSNAQWLLSDKGLSTRPRDICFSLNERRTLHQHRLAVTFASVDEAANSLESFHNEKDGWEKSVSIGEGKQERQKLLFMFGGQGAQWFGMGKELLLKEDVFADIISEIDKILHELGERWNLKDELLATEEASKVNEMVIGQIATFSVQMAIARLLTSWGIYPSAVVGHSLGEYAASCVAGAVSLKQALKLVLLRAKLQSQCPKNGSMAALGMSAGKAQHLLQELKLEATISIAAYNDADSVTLSGDKQSIECFEDYLTVNDVKVFWRVLNTPRAYHSRHVAPIEKSFKSAAQKEKLRPKETSIPFYSTVEGAIVQGRELDSSYWWRNIRNPVKFHQAIKSALEDGFKKIVEISAQPTLAHYIKQMASQEKLEGDDKPIVFPTLPRKTVKEQHKSFIQNTVCNLSVIGCPIQWHQVRGPALCSFVRTPTYPWQEKEWWFRQHAPEEIVTPLQPSTKVNQESIKSRNPFLGKALTTQQFTGISCWSVEIDLYRHQYLEDHALTQGGAIMPGAAYIELALAMAKDRFPKNAIELHDVKLTNVLTLPESQVRPIKLRLATENYPVGKFDITTVQQDQTELKLCSGNIVFEARIDAQTQGETSTYMQNRVNVCSKIKALQERMEEMSTEEFYNVTKKYGFAYGPCFSLIKKVWKAPNEGLVLVNMDSDVFRCQDVQDELNKYVIHPSVLDACLQSCFVPISDIPNDKTIVPVGFQRIQFTSKRVEKNTFCHVVKNANRSCFDVTLMTLDGNTILKMKDFQVAELDSAQENAPILDDNLTFEITWKEASFESVQSVVYKEHIGLILMDTSQESVYFTELLEERGVEVHRVQFPESKDFTALDEEEIERALKHSAQSCQQCKKKLNIISFWPIEADLVPEEIESIDRAQNITFKSSLYIIKLIGNLASETGAIQLTFVTQGIVCMEEQTFSMKTAMPWSATIWGLRRTASIEDPTTTVRTVDLSPVTTKQEMELLANQFALTHNEEEMAIRGHSIFTNRVESTTSAYNLENPSINDNKASNVHFNQDPDKQVAITVASDYDNQATNGSFYVEQGPDTSKIFLRSDTHSKLLQNEVEVELFYLFSTDDKVSSFANDSVQSVGFSGRVAYTKSHAFKVGEEVFGITNGRRIGKRLKRKDKELIRKPQEMSLKQSAVLPSCFTMALEIVQRTTSQQKFSRLLVHEGDSSLGFAVTTVAVMQGLQVCCTVNGEFTEIKKGILFQSGVKDIFDLPCSDIEDEYECYFDAVVFTSSPYPGALHASYRLMKTKAALILACGDVGGSVVLPVDKRIRYERLYPEDLLSNPAAFSGKWNKHCDFILSSALIRKVHEVPQLTTDLVEAIKRWNNGNEKSECAIFKSYTFESTDVKMLPASIDHFGLKENRTYIVAGGVKGFGFEFARWMCLHGAHTVVLLARSKPSQEKMKEVEDLQATTGATVLIFQVDVSREDHIEDLKQHLQHLPSVAGILHTAMVLRDGLIKDIDMNSHKYVMDPKVKGGYLLHKLSLKMDLDFFIMFSSMASLIGNISQASYSAANAFLDALASYRRHVLRLPGLSINWGPISGAGVLTRQTSIAKLLSNVGIGTIPALKGPELVSKILRCQPTRTQVGLINVDWPTFLESSKYLSTSSRLENLQTEKKEGSSVYVFKTLSSSIPFEKDVTKRTSMINEFVINLISHWADMDSTSEIDVNTSLYNYGFDSTAALSLKMSIESNLQISFEMFYFMQPETTPARIAKDIAKRFETSSGGTHDEENDSETQASTQEAEKRKLHRQISSRPINSELDTKPACKVIPLYTPEDAEIKFFCVHPSHRFAMSLASIATGFQIQNVVSFYAIGFADPIHTDRHDWGSVREMATQYVHLIRKEQEHGPYFIGGYSYGGLVSYEMACILEELNERVEFVCMVDTYPWFSGGYLRLTSWFNSEFSPRKQIQMQFEAYIEKVALQNLKIPKENYEKIKSQHPLEKLVKILEEKSKEMNVPVYDLNALWESLLYDHEVAHRTHEEWEPPAVQYNGHVTYLGCQDKKFLPRPPLMGTVEKSWKRVVPGPVDVLVCPGNHFTLSELPFARITGGIIATAVVMKYRSILPELRYYVDMTYVYKKAVKRLQAGVPAILQSTKDQNGKVGKLFLDNESKAVIFCKGEHCTKPSKLTGKVVHFQDLRCVLQGKYVRKTIKSWSFKLKNEAKRRGGNLSNVVSLFEKQRIINIEFLNIEDLKDFYLLIEGLFNVKMDIF